ncbi:MAG TPA: hypothetical protein VLD85_05600 [Anaeromyxobacteraceae bacterium]|nr:hypothetical protein [Anaeromyxobacteraceae bacterium]
MTQLGRSRAELKVQAGPVPEGRQPPTVGLGEVVVEPRLPPETLVEKTSGWTVPLLFVNLWKAEYRCQLGAAQLNTDLATFSRQSLAEHLRSGSRHVWADQGAELQVDVAVRKVTMEARLREAGHLLIPVFFFMYENAIRAGPAQVTIEAEVVVRRNGQEVGRRALTARGMALPPKERPWRTENYTMVMAASLTAAMDELGDQVVTVVDEGP